MKHFTFYVLVLLGIFAQTASSVNTHDFIAGADMSHVAWIENTGIQYKVDGQVADPITILKDRGINYIRLRQYTSSAEQATADPYNAINNQKYNIPLAKRIKAAGMKLLLNFHYSDTWADPAHQTKPKAWQELSYEELKKALYEYNRDSMIAYKQAGVIPDMVQIGNETRPGMLWPEGRNDSDEQWDKYAELTKEAIRGIRDGIGTEKMPKIMIHIDSGGSWGQSKWFFDNLIKRDVKFDIIGQSYYPFWHGTLEDLENCLINCVTTYGKPVLLVETSFPWALHEHDQKASGELVGIMPGKEGQVEFVEKLNQILAKVPDSKGIGIFWWAAEFIQVPDVNMATFSRQSFFDAEGNALPVIAALGKLSTEPRPQVQSTGNAEKQPETVIIPSAHGIYGESFGRNPNLHLQL